MDDVESLLTLDDRFRTRKPDFLVLSGDVANTGSRAEFDRAFELLIRPLLDVTEIPTNHVIVVPGNHDIDQGAISDLGNRGLALPFSCQSRDWQERSGYDDWCNDPGAFAELREPFAAFRQFAANHFGISDADITYTRTIAVGAGGGEVDIHVVGWNTALFCGRRLLDGRVSGNRGGSPVSVEFRTNEYGGLFVGGNLIERGLSGVPPHGLFPHGGEKQAVRIAVFHHPLSWLTLPERLRLRAALAESFDFVLYGHEHEQRIVEERGTDGECLFLPAGPSFLAGNEAKALPTAMVNPHGLAYNILTLDLETQSGTIFLRRYDPRRKLFLGWDFERFPNGEYSFRLKQSATVIYADANTMSHTLEGRTGD